MSDIITREEIINHPIDKVWSAISKAEEIFSWFLDADFKAEAGTSYTFTASPEQNCMKITGEVKVANPYTLIYTWIVENTDVVTTVKWELEQDGENTKLHLEHSGIAGYQGETAVAMFEDFSGGWLDCIQKLNKYLMEPVNAG